MPRIPVYEQQLTPSQGFDGGRASPVRSGLSDVAAGLSDVANVMVARKKQQEEDDARTWFATSAPQADLAMMEHMEARKAEAPPGADGFTPTYLKEFDTYAADATKNAPNEYAKRMMTAHLAQTRAAYGMQALRYEAGERTRYRAQTITEGVDSAAKLVMSDPSQAERWLGAMNGIIQTTQLDAETRAKLTDYARTNIAWYGTIGEIDRDPAAWEPGGSTWNQLDAAQQARAQQYAETKAKEADAQGKSDTFIGAARSVVSSAWMMPGEILNLPAMKAEAVRRAEAARGPLDPSDRMALEGYVEQLAADRERDTKRNHEAQVAGLFDQLDANGGDYQQVQAENPWVVNLPREYRERVGQYAGAVATGMTRETDWQVYTTLVDDPAVLRDANLPAMRDSFNAREYAQLVQTQEKLKNDALAGQDILTTKQVTNDLLRDAGVTNKDRQSQFYSMLQSAIDTELAATGKKKLPQSRVKELAADLLTSVVTSRGALWDSKSKAFALQVPPDERAKIEAALAAAGLPVTDYTVTQAYRQKLDKQGQP